MLKKLLPALALTALGWLAAPAAQAQTPNGPRPCGFDEQQRHYFDTHPGEEQRYTRFLYDAAHPTAQQRAALLAAPDVTIPIVVHVLYSNIPTSNANSASNISDRQITDALNILNRDFRKANPDTAAVIQRFQPLIANVGFKFALARKDPNGQPTTGITRYNTFESNFATAGVTGVVYWDPDRYLNLWIVDDIASGAGGYTFGSLCGGAGGTDGIVLRSSQFGPSGRSCGSNLCIRSLTHEVGHYFSLSHTWGRTNTPGDPANCGLSDGIADTPTTAGYRQNLGACDITYAPCRDGSGTPILSNVQNYMDYADCEMMFTMGQRQAMRATLTSPLYACRGNLVSAANLVSTGTNDGFVPATPVPVAFFNPTVTSVCEGGSVSFRDYSYNFNGAGGQPTYAWSFPGGTPATASGNTATVTYATSGVYSVTLTVTNSAGSNTYTANQLINVQGASTGLTGPVAESFETPGFFSSATAQRSYTTFGTVPTGATNKPGFPSTAARWQQRNDLPAADGQYYLRVNGNVAANGISNLVTPNIDLSNTTRPASVTFKRAYALRNALNQSTEQLRVAFSTDCGLNWISATTFTAANLTTQGTTPAQGYTPGSAADWQPLSVAIPANMQGSTHFQVRFQFANGNLAGNIFYLDDLRVAGPLGSRADALAARNIAIYPNPHTQETAVHLTLAAATRVEVRLTDVLGREVLALPAKQYGAGDQAIGLQGAQALRSGVYVVRISLDGQVYTSKLTVN